MISGRYYCFANVFHDSVLTSGKYCTASYFHTHKEDLSILPKTGYLPSYFELFFILATQTDIIPASTNWNCIFFCDKEITWIESDVIVLPVHSLITNPREILLWNNCRLPCHLKTYLLKFYLHVASWPRSYVASRFNVSGANPRIIGHSKLFANISPYDNYPFSEQLSVFRELIESYFNTILLINHFLYTLEHNSFEAYFQYYYM